MKSVAQFRVILAPLIRLIVFFYPRKRPNLWRPIGSSACDVTRCARQQPNNDNGNALVFGATASHDIVVALLRPMRRPFMRC